MRTFGETEWAALCVCVRTSAWRRGGAGEPGAGRGGAVVAYTVHLEETRPPLLCFRHSTTCF